MRIRPLYSILRTMSTTANHPPGTIVLPNGKILTPEDVAKQRAAKDAKKAKAAANRAAQGEEAPEDVQGKTVLKRNWVETKMGKASVKSNEDLRFKLLTWNILAQTLVRRELFPGCDALKWKDRKDMVSDEINSYPGDIVCLQECDQLDHFSTLMPSPAFENVSAKGPKKLHGLAIFFRTSLFRLVSSKVVYLDEEPLAASEGIEVEGEDEDAMKDRRRKERGGTRQTKNIGLFAMLESVKAPGKGLVVGTTHLFWHPHYCYERTRQSLILAKNAFEFRKEASKDWPVVLAGDFNTSPSEPTYNLLTNPHLPLSPASQEAIDSSRAVHTSLPNVELALHPQDNTGAPVDEVAKPKGPPPLVLGDRDDEKEEGEGDEEGEGQAADPGKMKNTRPPTDEDGLMTVDELQAVAKEVFGEGEGLGARSAYGESGWQEEEGMKGLTFGSRYEDGDAGVGANEPNWTSYTPLWHLTLDYIFDMQAQGSTSSLKPLQVLAPHQTKDIDKGLPRKGVCASDHVLLGVEYLMS